MSLNDLVKIHRDPLSSRYPAQCALGEGKEIRQENGYLRQL